VQVEEDVAVDVLDDRAGASPRHERVRPRQRRRRDLAVALDPGHGLRAGEVGDQLGPAVRGERVVRQRRVRRAPHSPITVRAGARRQLTTSYAPPPALPVAPEPFHPPNGCTPGHAPVVDPARRFTYTTPAWTFWSHSSISD